LLSAAADNPTIQLFDASPALFAENQGQLAEPTVRYIYQGDGANVAMTDAGPVFQVFQQPATTTPSASSGPAQPAWPPGLTGTVGADPLAPAATPAFQSETFSVNFPGANLVAPTGTDQAATVYNYLVGDQSQWHSNVPTYQKVAYDGLYAGIDLVTWGQRDSLKYEFHVAPGADYQQIRIHYDGIQGLSVDAKGVLHIQTALGELTDDTPFIYQQIGGRQVAVAGQFKLLDADTYTFTINGSYDPTRELVVDPDLAWSTYMGGSDGAAGEGIAVDSAGNALVAGNTNSADFSGANNSYHGGAFDTFVAKVSGAGDLVWATYLGGSGIDMGYGIAVDSDGNTLVTGLTDSTDFSGANNGNPGGASEAFVAKVSGAGALVWATYIGGSGGGPGTVGNGIAVDSAGNTLVTGYTGLSHLSGANNTFKGGYGDYNAFVAKISSAGALAWATYLGGSVADIGNGIAVDSAGSALVTGYTESTDFSGAINSFHGGQCDTFVAKVTSAGALAWATYLGGSGDDEGEGIAVDSAGNAMLTGYTDSTDFSGANNSFHGGEDAFVAKVTCAGNLAWATYLGGSGQDFGNAIAVDSAGSALVTGGTASTDFSGANNSYFGGGEDAFVAKVTSAGTLAWATYLGGSSGDWGSGIAVDSAGNALVAGYTDSTDFSGANNNNDGGTDAFVAKLSGAAAPSAPAQTYNPQAAVAYANTWSQGSNSSRYTFCYDQNGDAADCADFVSQCLTAGGLDLEQGTIATRISDGAITGVADLDTYLSDYLGAVLASATGPLPRTSDPPAWFGLGDVAIFSDSNGIDQHAVIAVRGSGASAQCAAHSADTDITTIGYWFAHDPTWTACSYFQLVSTAQSPSSDFNAGEQIVASTAVNVRSPNQVTGTPTPCYGDTVVATIPKGQTAVIVSDPNNGTAYNGHYWWYVSWNGNYGWSAEDLFQSAAPGPVLNVGATSLTLLATTAGTVGAATSVTVSGSGLGSGDTVLLAAPTGSEISQNVSSGFASTLTLSPDASGNLSATTVYIRIRASATANVSGSLTIDDAMSSNLDESISVSGTVQAPRGVAIVTTLAGSAGQPGSSDGTGSAARFCKPWDAVVDSAGNVYVADAGNDEIRKITPSGVVTTLAGSAGQEGSNDGTGSAARFWYPEGVAVDSAGNVYVADTGNREIREITPSGVVTTLAGSAGQYGSSDGTGSAARFGGPAPGGPVGVAVDSAGNVYVGDYWNDEIRKITPSGVVTTLAGSAGQTGSSDGTGSAARFGGPMGVAVDSAGNVYVGDSENDEIRKITPSGVVTTVAGSAGQAGSSDGTGSAARFDYPEGVAVDIAGNVYVDDANNGEIREITPSGVVTTLAGSPGQIGSSDGTGSAARLEASGVAVDSVGNVYVNEWTFDDIRKITFAAPAQPTAVTTTPLPNESELSWDGVTGASSYQVWRSTTDNQATATEIASGIKGTTYDDATAIPGTTYYYWIVAAQGLQASTPSPPITGTAAAGSGTTRILDGLELDGNFSPSGGSGYTATGSIDIGFAPSSGQTFQPLLTVVAGKVSYDNSEIYVVGTVYADILQLKLPLFSGSFEIPMGQAGGEAESAPNTLNDPGDNQEIAGCPIDVTDLTLIPGGSRRPDRFPFHRWTQAFMPRCSSPARGCS
jgi:hypothetical protein